MSSRESILAAIRQHAPPQVTLPETAELGMRFDDPRAHFVKMVEAVGGDVLHAPNLAEADRQVRALEVYERSEKRFSDLTEVGESNIDLEQVDRPQDLKGTGLAILPGEFSVAENGAIWATDARLKHRAIYFICEHLVLCAPSSELVHNMHEAYQRLEFTEPSYGLFISGPSKTADIEQSLVIGAQGPRSLHVVMVDEWPPGRSS